MTHPGYVPYLPDPLTVLLGCMGVLRPLVLVAAALVVTHTTALVLPGVFPHLVRILEPQETGATEKDATRSSLRPYPSPISRSLFQPHADA